jgi:hypothetical protein
MIIEMPEWLAVILFIGAYVVLMKWILPRFGVPTCMSNSCSVESRHESERKAAKSG